MFDNSGVMRYRIETRKGRSLPLRSIGFYIILIARCFKHTLKKGEEYMQKIRKAVIPAAGFGTRFLPATKATPKEALASGIEEILIISGHAKRAIEDHFDSARRWRWSSRRRGRPSS